MDFYASVDDVLHDTIRQLDRPAGQSTPAKEGTPAATPAPRNEGVKEAG